MKTAVDISPDMAERQAVTLHLAAEGHFIQGNDATAVELARGRDMIRALRTALTASEKNARRYTILCQHVIPLELARGLELEWTDIPEDQSIDDKIGELCDAGLAAGRLLP